MVDLLFRILRVLVPARVTEAGPLITPQEQKVFRRWQITFSTGVIAASAGLGWAWFELLRLLTGAFTAPRPADVAVFAPDAAIWWMVGGALGIVTASQFLWHLQRVSLGDRYPRFIRWHQGNVQFDSWRVVGWLSCVILVAAPLASAWAILSVTRVQAGGILIGAPLSFGKRSYTFTQVRSIQERPTIIAPNGDIVHRPHFAISFEDGRVWRTIDGFRDPDPVHDRKIVTFISEQSGREIEVKP